MPAQPGSLIEFNRPGGKLCMNDVVRSISMLPDIVIQSMFVHGPIDNTGPREIEAWSGWLQKLAPQAIQIDSLDRMPAKSWVRSVPRSELDTIAAYVEGRTGIRVEMFG